MIRNTVPVPINNSNIVPPVEQGHSDGVAKQNVFIKILFCKHYFSPLNTFMRKGKELDPDLDL
jgi:hypothetical protein